MGQYFNIFNLDKKEKLNPRCFGEGLKLMEFGSDSLGVLTGLTLLLRQSSGGGGGDFNSVLYYANKENFTDLRSTNELLGSWAGDKVSIIGDYDDSEIYDNESYKDISHEVIELLETDTFVKERRDSRTWAFPCSCNEKE